MVNIIETSAQYDAMLELSKTKLCVVDFHAVWCGPCLMIAPMYVKLSEANADVAFYKSDVDEADEVAARCGIQAMPTFQFYKGGVKVDELRGADVNKLNELIAEHK